jgi:hypothetical protein
MKTATGLTLIAIGAIFAFAISGHPSWINLHIVGWVIMLTGIIGMVITRTGYARRLRWPLARQQPQPPQPPGGSQPAAITGTVISGEPAPGSGPPPTASAPGETPGGMPPSTASPGEPNREPYEE